MRDDRERWVLGTSYHKAMENYLRVAPIRPGQHRYRFKMKLQRCNIVMIQFFIHERIVVTVLESYLASLKKGGTA